MPVRSSSVNIHPNHWVIILPDRTMYFQQTEQRSSSPPLSVDDFIKKSSIIYYSREALEEVHEDIESFAKSEQLTAHANSIAVRFE